MPYPIQWVVFMCFNRNECLLLLLLFLPFLSRDFASSCFLCGDIHSSDSSVKVIAVTPAICKDKPLSCPIYKCQRHGFMCIPASSILKGCCSLHGCWTKFLSNSPCPLQSLSYSQSFLKYCILWHRSLVPPPSSVLLECLDLLRPADHIVNLSFVLCWKNQAYFTNIIRTISNLTFSSKVIEKSSGSATCWLNWQ